MFTSAEWAGLPIYGADPIDKSDLYFCSFSIRNVHASAGWKIPSIESWERHFKEHVAIHLIRLKHNSLPRRAHFLEQWPRASNIAGLCLSEHKNSRGPTRFQEFDEREVGLAVHELSDPLEDHKVRDGSSVL
ncbi:MAG: hypothetical protein WCI12_11645 [Actinomycetes bacterium]